LGDVITTTFKPFGRGLGLLAAGIVVLALGGCGGIEFQGAVFDWVGLSGTGTKGDVRMSERAPLLVPPNISRLPAPGSPPIARADWPSDTDVARKQLVAAKEAEESKKTAAAEPNNPYAGKSTLLKRLFGGKKTDENEDLAVPEPDPSDKTAQDRAREQAAGAPAPKPVDQTLNAPTQAEDPFHPAAPDSYKGMSNPSGNNANW
jgi:hypothetical protein